MSQKLLRYTNDSIAEISAKCGFTNLNYFSRSFRQIEGIAPREYRQIWSES